MNYPSSHLSICDYNLYRQAGFVNVVMWQGSVLSDLTYTPYLHVPNDAIMLNIYRTV